MLKIFFGKCSKNQAPNLCQKPSKAVGNLLRLSLYQTKAHAEYIERETYLPGVNTVQPGTMVHIYISLSLVQTIPPQP